MAAFHAGWRGVIGGVVANAFNNMSGRVRPESLIVAVGPGISKDAFEVGPEVVDEFQKAFGPDAPARRTPDGKGRVDLQRAILISTGEGRDTHSNQIDTTDRCTFQDRDEFFSHRRDKGITGPDGGFDRGTMK